MSYILIYAEEPDGLANLITNMAVEKCANAADAYLSSTKYALAQLDFENVAVYLDAAHAGWLGWPDNVCFHLASFLFFSLSTS